MQVIVTSIVFSIVWNIVSANSTKEPPKDLQQKITTVKPILIDNSPEPYSINNNLNSLWVYRPNSHHSQLSGDDFGTHRVVFKAPHSLTKLAKTLSSGFDPYFSKGYFEPFERRSRPVTLVAFRKNGFAPRRSIRVAESKSLEVAELQSPYNDIGNFWQDEPGDS